MFLKLLQRFGLPDFLPSRIAIDKITKTQVVHDEVADILQEGLAVFINKGRFQLKSLTGIFYIK